MQAVEAAVSGGAAFLGFMFYPPSPRDISPAKAQELSASVPDSVEKVAVTVNPTNNELENILQDFSPDYIQLHGKESPATARKIKEKYGLGIIKAIAVRNADDVATASQYIDIADILLFDARAPVESALPGGNGLRFDWHILCNRDFSLPWMLAGGLNADNIEEAVKTTGAEMVDVSSGLEIEPGVKSPQLITDFLEKVNAIK